MKMSAYTPYQRIGFGGEIRRNIAWELALPNLDHDPSSGARRDSRQPGKIGIDARDTTRRFAGIHDRSDDEHRELLVGR